MVEANCTSDDKLGSLADLARFFDLFVAMCNHVDDIVDIS